MTLYNGILARIEALGDRPDIAALDSIDRTLEQVFATRPANGGPTRAYTRSLDAALALCERVLPGRRVMLWKDISDDAWGAHFRSPDSDTHYAPHLALAVVAAVLADLIASGQDDTSDGKEIPGRTPQTQTGDTSHDQ